MDLNLDLGEKLSANFTLKELLRSDIAERQSDLKRAQYNPPARVLGNLARLAEGVLQPMRERLGFPIRIVSAYRSDEVNLALGSPTGTPHSLGRGADCSLSSRFLTDPAAAAVRARIESRVRGITGKTIRSSVNANFYFFAFVCLNLSDFPVAQVIHEYGEGFGMPAWVHLTAAEENENRKEILSAGGYVLDGQESTTLENALRYGV